MKLSIQPLLPIGNYLNKRYGMEMDFPDDSNPFDNFKYLTETVTAIHMAEFPMFYKDGVPLFLPTTTTEYNGEEQERQVKEPPTKLSKEEKQKAEISSCTDITVLESYRLIVKKYPYLQDVYNETMEKLTKKD